jgi:hypothetical protein
MSGFGLEEKESLELFLNAKILKPIMIKELLEIVRRVLDQNPKG